MPSISVFGRPFVKRFALCYGSVVLSVCFCPVLSIGLSVTLVYCGQTVGRIKMKLGMHVGFGPHHIVLDGDPAPPPQKEHTPIGWIKMVLDMELGLSPGDFVLDGDPAPSPKRGRSPFPNVGPCLLCPNGWMDQGDTWHGGGPLVQATLC